MTSAKHSGDIGDIIYGLPTMRYFGAGRLFLSRNRITRVMMNDQSLAFLRDLIMSQVYMERVEMWRGQPVCYDFDQFRPYWRKNEVLVDGKELMGDNLAEWQARLFGAPPNIVDKRWLDVPEKKVAKVVISRSTRYHTKTFPWQRVADRYRLDCVFVGLAEEHRSFCEQFGEVPFFKVRDAYEMAQVIEGSLLFIGNQGFPDAVAEGLKKRKIQEPNTAEPRCVFDREDVQYVWTKHIWLPEV